MRGRAVGATLSLVLGSWTDRALACSCEESSLEQRVERARAVFVGQVLEGAMLPSNESEPHALPGRAFRLRVLQTLKGVEVGDDVTVLTGYGGADCGLQFFLGETAVVVGYPRPSPGVVTANLCTGASLQELEKIFPSSAAKQANVGAGRHEICPRTRELAAIAEGSAVVFSGPVLSGCFEEASSDGLYLFRADRIWKGAEVDDLLRVRFPTDARLEVGDQPIVFASHDGDVLRADPCAPVDTTFESLAVLDDQFETDEERTRALAAVEDELARELLQFEQRIVAQSDRSARDRLPTSAEAQAAKCGRLDVSQLDKEASRPSPPPAAKRTVAAAPNAGGCAGCSTVRSAGHGWSLVPALLGLLFLRRTAT